jgi:hypothetical protein
MIWILGALVLIAIACTRLRRPEWPPRPSDLSEHWRRNHLYTEGKS